MLVPQKFDPELWRSRAYKRYTNAVASGNDHAEAYMRDITNVQYLSALIGWCRERGLDVEFVNNDTGGAYVRDDRLITINCHLLPEAQLHTLMHECGHHLIGPRSAEQRYGNGYPADDPGVKRSATHRIDILDEEFEAWARGLKLAKRLGVKIDVERYNRTKAKCITSHLKWTLKFNGKEDA